MKIRVCKANERQINQLVAKIEGLEFDEDGEPIWFERDGLAEPRSTYEPATDWSQGGPIIEREKIGVVPSNEDANVWIGSVYEPDWRFNLLAGPTPLIAAMRSFVASKLGDEVEIPEGLA